MYVVATALWTLGEIGFSTAAPTLVAAMSPVDRRGVYQGAYQLAWGMATMIAPVIGTATLAHFGGATLWLGCLAACWLAAPARDLHRALGAVIKSSTAGRRRGGRALQGALGAQRVYVLKGDRQDPG